MKPQVSINWLISLVGVIGFVGFGYQVIERGHFHEDAYILFKYVQNIVAGNGISFSAHLGPAEGATDFLWLIALALLHSLGLGIGASAFAVNSLGLLSTLYWLNRLSDGASSSTKVLTSFLSLTILLSDLSYAAGGGFSIWAYLGIIAPIMTLFLIGDQRAWFVIPILSLVLGLLRPDGLIIGISFTLIAAYKVYLSKKNLKFFVVSCVVSFAVGLAYFIWRASYFDTLLPLPLLVKSNTAGLFDGWTSNLAWAISFQTLIVTLIFFMIFVNVLRRMPRQKNVSKANARTSSTTNANSSITTTSQLSAFGFKPLLVCSLPFLLHLIAIGFAHQSQNVGFRFQAPQTLFLYALFILVTVHLMTLLRRWKGIVIALLLLSTFALTGIENTRQNFRYLAGRNYINVFPLWFNELLPKDSLVAVTEAGRLPFWANNYRYIDLVGLNTTELAHQKLTVEYLEKQNPTALFIWYDTGDKEALVSDVSIEYLASLNASYKQTLGSKMAPTTVTASIVAADYLVQSGDYDLISVHYWNSHNHLFAFKQGALDLDEVKQRITDFSEPQHAFSYSQMQRVVDSGKSFEALYE